ncbi:MAG: MBL fold metallo-hydrolase, partial [Candidatus Thermoplasmatota archaeon]|nr:MBL fold metallo-hydrolase [Candidatus Thermoplasmatota archaeon]
VEVRVGNNTFVYFGDLIPTSAHIKPAYVMAYDLYPMDTFYKKREILEKAYEESWTIFFEHDPTTPVAKLSDVENYTLKKISF